MPDRPSHVARKPVEYRGPQGATLWTDARPWDNMPTIGTILYHDDRAFAVTGVITFDDARPPCIFVKGVTPIGMRSIKLQEVK